MIFRIIYSLIAISMFIASPAMAKVVTKVSDAPKQGDFLAYIIALVAVIATFAISFTGAKRVKEED